jgi:hypothetical protein
MRVTGAALKCPTVLIRKAQPWRSQMAAIAAALSRVSGIQVDTENLKLIAIFCGAGLTASLIAASYGLDLSAGFF